MSSSRLLNRRGGKPLRSRRCHRLAETIESPRRAATSSLRDTCEVRSEVVEPRRERRSSAIAMEWLRRRPRPRSSRCARLSTVEPAAASFATYGSNAAISACPCSASAVRSCRSGGRHDAGAALRAARGRPWPSRPADRAETVHPPADLVGETAQLRPPRPLQRARLDRRDPFDELVRRAGGGGKLVETAPAGPRSPHGCDRRCAVARGALPAASGRPHLVEPRAFAAPVEPRVKPVEPHAELVCETAQLGAPGTLERACLERSQSLRQSIRGGALRRRARPAAPAARTVCSRHGVDAAQRSPRVPTRSTRPSATEREADRSASCSCSAAISSRHGAPGSRASSAPQPLDQSVDGRARCRELLQARPQRCDSSATVPRLPASSTDAPGAPPGRRRAAPERRELVQTGLHRRNLLAPWRRAARCLQCRQALDQRRCGGAGVARLASRACNAATIVAPRRAELDRRQALYQARLTAAAASSSSRACNAATSSRQGVAASTAASLSTRLCAGRQGELRQAGPAALPSRRATASQCSRLHRRQPLYQACRCGGGAASSSSRACNAATSSRHGIAASRLDRVQALDERVRRRARTGDLLELCPRAAISALMRAACGDVATASIRS